MPPNSVGPTTSTRGAAEEANRASTVSNRQRERRASATYSASYVFAHPKRSARRPASSYNVAGRRDRIGTAANFAIAAAASTAEIWRRQRSSCSTDVTSDQSRGGATRSKPVSPPTSNSERQAWMIADASATIKWFSDRRETTVALPARLAWVRRSKCAPKRMGAAGCAALQPRAGRSRRPHAASPLFAPAGARIGSSVGSSQGLAAAAWQPPAR